MRPDSKAPCCQFERRYEVSRAPAVRELERCVLGCDYGGTSATTREEADRLAEHLSLRPGMHLLEVGAGSGWPGLYLAQRSGCDVTLADVPLSGLRAALERAAHDGLAHLSRGVVADGARLPFGERRFDAVSHSDVLCCMPAKLEMLRECRRVARAGARMEFSVIDIVPGLSDAERRLAIDSGPEHVEAPDDYGALLARSDWKLLDRTDVTAPFTRVVRVLFDETLTRGEALIAALGPEEYDTRLSRRRALLAATERGLLKREIFLASAAPG